MPNIPTRTKTATSNKYISLITIINPLGQWMWQNKAKTSAMVASATELTSLIINNDLIVIPPVSTESMFSNYTLEDTVITQEPLKEQTKTFTNIFINPTPTKVIIPIRQLENINIDVLDVIDITWNAPQDYEGLMNMIKRPLQKTITTPYSWNIAITELNTILFLTSTFRNSLDDYALGLATQAANSYLKPIKEYAENNLSKQLITSTFDEVALSNIQRFMEWLGHVETHIKGKLPEGTELPPMPITIPKVNKFQEILTKHHDFFHQINERENIVANTLTIQNEVSNPYDDLYMQAHKTYLAMEKMRKEQELARLNDYINQAKEDLNKDFKELNSIMGRNMKMIETIIEETNKKINKLIPEIKKDIKQLTQSILNNKGLFLGIAGSTSLGLGYYFLNNKEFIMTGLKYLFKLGQKIDKKPIVEAIKDKTLDTSKNVIEELGKKQISLGAAAGVTGLGVITKKALQEIIKHIKK